MLKENTTANVCNENEVMQDKMQKATEKVVTNVLDRGAQEFAETGDNNKQSEYHCLVVKVTVQALINALSKIEDKEQYVVISQKHDHFTYLQSVYELADQIEDDDKVVALVDSIEKPSEYFTPNKVL